MNRLYIRIQRPVFYISLSIIIIPPIANFLLFSFSFWIGCSQSNEKTTSIVRCDSRCFLNFIRSTCRPQWRHTDDLYSTYLSFEDKKEQPPYLQHNMNSRDLSSTGINFRWIFIDLYTPLKRTNIAYTSTLAIRWAIWSHVLLIAFISVFIGVDVSHPDSINVQFELYTIDDCIYSFHFHFCSFHTWWYREKATMW